MKPVLNMRWIFIADARTAIQTEKQAAMAEVKGQLAGLVLTVAEKVLKDNLKDDAAQTALIDKYVKDVNLN